MPSEVVCRFSWYISDRWFQDRKDDKYILSDKDVLYGLKWSRILEGDYTGAIILRSDVEDFYASERGLAVIGINGRLVLPGSQYIRPQDRRSRYEVDHSHRSS